MMTMCRALLVSSLVALSLPTAANAAAFRGSPALGDAPHGVSDLLHELEKVAGRDHRLATESRVDRLEQALKPMFSVLHKDAEGRLQAAGVRYVLHRLFVQRHGWFVEGLESDGGAWDSSSPAAVFRDHSAHHHSLFDDKLSEEGFSLHQVAVFAATLETLVHAENIQRLQATYRLQGLSPSDNLSEEQAKEAIRGYMVLFVRVPQGMNISTLTRSRFDWFDRKSVEEYPAWPDTERFAEGVRQRIVEDVMDDDRNTWDTNLRIIEEIGERYGRWQARECHVLKDTLVSMEKPGSGRVRLADFYSGALQNNSWLFSESVPYLRQLGALDESDPQQPSVIIPNYLASPSNCVASSKFYSACCIDECEDLLGSIEQAIGEPDATPARVAELVAALPSDTVQARSLPPVLISRLEEIAKYHGGRIPLHGRLFAQWLHHAYPRECPYPHVSGTTKPMTQEEWIAHSSEPCEAEGNEIKRILEEAAKVDGGILDNEAEHVLPWHAEEELFVSRPKLPEREASSGVGRSVLMVGLLGAVFLVIRPRSAQSKSLLPYSNMKDHKYYV